MTRTPLFLTLLLATMLAGCNPVREGTLSSTPVLGLSFSQGDEEPAPVSVSGNRAYVTAVKAPFEIRFRNPAMRTLHVCAFRSMPATYLDIEGKAVESLPCTGRGSGYALPRGYETFLIVGDNGQNYYTADRQLLRNDNATIKVGEVNYKHLYPYTTDIELLAFIDKDNDGVFDAGEYEYIVLRDPDDHAVNEEALPLLAKQQAFRYISFLDKRSRYLLKNNFRFERDGVSFRGKSTRFYSFDQIKAIYAVPTMTYKGHKYMGVGYTGGHGVLKKTIKWMPYSKKLMAGIVPANLAMIEAMAAAEENSLESIERLYHRPVTYFSSPEDARQVLLREFPKARTISGAEISDNKYLILHRADAGDLKLELHQLQMIRSAVFRELPQAVRDKYSGDRFLEFAEKFEHALVLSLYYGKGAAGWRKKLVPFPLYDKDAAFRVTDALIYLASEKP